MALSHCGSGTRAGQQQQPQQQLQQQPPQPGRAAPQGQKFRKLAKEKKDRSTERQYILPKERYSFRLPLSPPQPDVCRVAAGWRVYITSGSPASKKRRPFELRGRTGDSLHEPVDTAACTSFLVSHIIPSTSLLQSVEGEKTDLRAVVTASGQHTVTSATARRLVACSVDTSAASRQLDVCTATSSVTSTTLAEPPPFHGMPPLGAEEYGLFLDSVPQLSARPLSYRYACWRKPRDG